MRDPNFERTVILLCQRDEDGAVGMVINRPHEITVGDVAGAAKVAPPRHEEEVTWWGGPVSPGTCFVLWRGRAEVGEGWTIGDEIAVSPALERLERLVQIGRHFHLVLGYSGWGEQQLESEIERGSWLYTEADPSIVFDTPIEERYDRALGLLGLTASTVWMQPIDE
ncbi:MAG: YqgE/AlgH family protein [Myxococcota bacterium]